MKVTDFIAKFLKKNKVNQVFGLQGGAVVHIFDSLIKNKIGVTFTHHEASAALAAGSNAKIKGEVGCVVVTTGPATTNAMTGLLAAWQDSVPVIFISGQARSANTSYNKKIRQAGTQEVNICDIVKPITKYAKFIKDKKNIVAEFNKALEISKSDRPGPVWLDIALDVQWQDIFIASSKIKYIKKKNFFNSNKNIDKTIKKINSSKRPIFIIGSGVKNSNLNKKELKKFFSINNIPFVLTWNTIDLFETSMDQNLGIIGMSGLRGANKSVFNSDLIICLGNHLPIPQTTTLNKFYAKNAQKIIVNIDKNEIKNSYVKFDLKLNMDAGVFFKKINKKIKVKKNSWYSKYKEMNWYEPAQKKNYINPNRFIRMLSNQLDKKSAIIIDGGGTALYAGFQSSIVKENTKIICSSSISAMGTGLAETIGVGISKKFNKLVCVIGDGSLLMNSQDLQTIAQKKFNVIIVLVNNKGYLAIRHTQKEFLKENYIGTDLPDITFPNFKNLANAYNLKYIKINNEKNIKKIIKKLNIIKGPIICDLSTDPNGTSLFKQGYSKKDDGSFQPMNLEEMYPFTKGYISNTNN